MSKIAVLRASCVALGVLVAGGAAAQSTWNLVSGSGCTQNTTNAGNFNNSYACTGVGSAGNSATISGWSSNADRGTGGYYSLSGSGFVSSYLAPQGTSGFGVTSRAEANAARAAGDTTPLNPASPNHSVDAIAPGSFDFVMVTFSTAVILDQIRIGWGATDSDITIMRWAGAGAPGTTAGTVTNGGGNQNLDSTIAANGWVLVDSYSDVCRNASNVAMTSSSNSCHATNSTRSTGATTAASTWLIAAYNTTMDAAKGWTSGNDGFKLNWLRTIGAPPPPGVPAPGSLALASLAIVGLWAHRRRERRAR